MQKPQPKYKFYATLLDAFNWYQASESENAEKEFMDKINRVPITDEKALKRMRKGTALNNLLDSIIVNGYDNLCDEIIIFDGFEFNTCVVRELASKLQGSIPQFYTETMIRCDGGDVLVYGYIDYILGDRIIDLKTTSDYYLGKYKDSMQMHIYTLALLNQENIMTEHFEFLVTDGENVYSETYPVNSIYSKARLVEICNALIMFIEGRKEYITDKKIFGLD